MVVWASLWACLVLSTAHLWATLSRRWESFVILTLVQCAQHIPAYLGACPECVEVIGQPCRCGKFTKERPCSDPEWSCETVSKSSYCVHVFQVLCYFIQVCSNLLSCGHHHCQQVCHSGECGGCPSDGERTCPCGKKCKFIQNIVTCYLVQNTQLLSSTYSTLHWRGANLWWHLW